MMGLLPEVAAEFQISIPSAASVKWPRRNVLIGLMVVFTAGNLLAAMASSYEMLLAARALTGLPHGAFFGIGSVVAAGMVGPDRRATAISMMFAALTVASVVGVAGATLRSRYVGWGATFGVLAVIGVASVAAIALLVPQPAQAPPVRLSREIAAF